MQLSCVEQAVEGWPTICFCRCALIVKNAFWELLRHCIVESRLPRTVVWYAAMRCQSGKKDGRHVRLEVALLLVLQCHHRVGLTWHVCIVCRLELTVTLSKARTGRTHSRARLFRLFVLVVQMLCREYQTQGLPWCHKAFAQRVEGAGIRGIRCLRQGVGFWRFQWGRVARRKVTLEMCICSVFWIGGRLIRGGRLFSSCREWLFDGACVGGDEARLARK